MTNIQIINLSNLLAHFSDKKVPFSIVLTKNIKKVEEAVKQYDEKRMSIISKFATTDENGAFIGKLQEDGTRIENPQTLDQLDVDDLQALVVELQKLDQEDTEIQIEKIDINKSYYDSELKEKRTVEDYVNSNIEASILNSMIEFGLIEL